MLRLKKEISATVKALDSTTMRGSISADRSSISSTTSADYRNSTHSTKQRNPASRRGSMFSALTSAFSRHGFGSSTDLQGLDGADTAQADLEERGSDGEESHMLISEQDVDTDALNAILGLCNLYATEEMQEMESQEAERSKTGPPSPLKTMTSQPFSSRRSGRNGEGDAEQGAETRRFGKIRFVRGQGSEVDDPNIDEGEDDGWEEVHLNTNRLSTHFRSSFGGAAGGSGVGFKRRMTSMFGGLAGGTGERRGSGDPAEEVLVSSNAVRMQGYLNKRKPGTTSVYQRRFFLLTDKQLMWFASEDDVEQHINRRKGAINIAQITNLDRYDPISLCILNIAVHSGRVYVLMAIDRSCADDWYDMIQECRQNLSKTKKNIVAGKRTSDAANDIDGEKLESRPSTSGTKVSFLPWFGGGGGEAADDGDSDARQDPPGGARTKNRPSSTFSLGFGVAHDDIHERVDEENDGGGVVQMLRRGTTSARRGLGSIFHAAAGAIPLVTAGNADGSAGAAPAESTEAWRAGWDTSDLPRKMGYMQKMGEINATWQQRWFVIEESGNLTWYDKAGAERHQKPKGCISIGEVVCIKGVDSDNPRLIEIRHIHGRVYQLEAGSELDATDWRSVLEQWVLSARVAIDKYNSENRDKLALDSNNQNSSTTYDQDQDDEEESKVPENTDSTPSGPQRKTGSMRKRGGTRNAAFKKRWFVLDHPGVLSWFEKVNGDKFGKPKGSINMGDVMCILAASYDSPCLVEVRHVEGRVYELEADSVQEAEDWRKALNVWLKFAYDLKKEQKITGAHAKAVPATEPKAGEFAGEDLGVTSSTDISAGDGKSSNTDVIKKRYFMYSKLGFSRGKGRGEPKGVSYAPVSVESGADPKRSPGSPVMELDDVYPQLTATERVEALTRERDNGVPDIATANGRGVSFITPTKSNPLFQSGSTFNMMPEAKVRGDESEDEEVTKFQQSSGTDLHSATSAEEQTSSRGSSPSLASAPSIASTPSMAPRSGRRARGPRRGSTVFSEICAQVAAQAPAQLAPTSTATNSAAMTNDEEVVPAYNRHRASIDSAIEERKKGMASQSISQQRALRHQATKRQNLIGEKKKIIHRESELADSKFMRRMAKRHSSELVDNLQKKSYKDMNSEFWATHTWYLACVVCFVTLNVLYSTSYIVSQY